jgi:hypothetical protein
LRDAHNRQVLGSSPGRPTIFSVKIPAIQKNQFNSKPLF